MGEAVVRAEDRQEREEAGAGEGREEEGREEEGREEDGREEDGREEGDRARREDGSDIGAGGRSCLELSSGSQG